MTLTAQVSIIENEKRLIDAQRNSDVHALDQLLHDDLLFTIPNGQIITKQIDLESHRNGTMVVDSNTPSEQVIKLIGDTAVVTTIVELKGKFNTQPINGKFRYIRVWRQFNDGWKMIAGSAVQIV
ncbi:MAG: nuclear transport factor 2 family protein [Bacteroidetes bacterium]|nr:nuclear transport factor 2 family protein [Bacteroidota bacterium]